MKNRYIVRFRIPETAWGRFLRCVAADLTAGQISQLTDLNRNTYNRLLACLRQRMAEACESSSPLSGTIEVDESYFRPRRVKGNAGRGAGKKTPVFGIFKRHGRVYTELVPDCSRVVLQRAIRGKVSLDSIIHSDGWRGYDGLVDLGYQKHLRVDHSKDEFASDTGRSNHISPIEGFWGFAKRRLAKFNGIPWHAFYLHLKETKFRFNHRGSKLYPTFIRLLRNQPL